MIDRWKYALAFGIAWWKAAYLIGFFTAAIWSIIISAVLGIAMKLTNKI